MIAVHDKGGAMAAVCTKLRAAWLRVHPWHGTTFEAFLLRRRGVGAAIDFSDQWLASCNARLKRGMLGPKHLKLPGCDPQSPLWAPMCKWLNMDAGCLHYASQNKLRLVPTWNEACKRALHRDARWGKLNAVAWMFLFHDVLHSWDALVKDRPAHVIVCDPTRTLRVARWCSGAIIAYRSTLGQSGVGWHYKSNRPTKLPPHFVWLYKGTAHAEGSVEVREINTGHPHNALITTKIQASTMDVYSFQASLIGGGRT